MSVAFQTSNVIGKRSEDRIADVLSAAGWYVDSTPDRHRYDLAVQFQCYGKRRWELVEVKNEDDQQHTGNFLVETFQGRKIRKPSGFAISDASVGINTLGDSCVIWRVRPMMRLIWDAMISQVNFGGKSDNGNGGVMFRTYELEGRNWFQKIAIDRLHESQVWTI